jgi:pimeloyl-ACP methyl ester carboxylesterase
VPLDYDDPSGDTIELALARIPARDTRHRIGTVFLNPGGPGGSGVDLAAFGFGADLAEKLQGRFDVVGFDPRGIARSTPLRCFETFDDAVAFFAEAPVFPYLTEQRRPYFDLNSAFADQCRERQSRIFAHMSTGDVVRDLDLLREAVGDRKLTYLGFSYGSFIGNTYANVFPGKVRALIIDGVLDPRLWANGLQIFSDRVATEAEFQEFLRLCDQAGAPACGLAGPGGAAQRFAALEASIRFQPFVFPDGFSYSYDFLIADAASAMYAPESWPDYADFFGALYDATAGDAAAATRARETRARVSRTLAGWRGGGQAQGGQAQGGPSRQEEYPNLFEGFAGNHCADTEYPRTLPLFNAIDRFAAAGSRFGPFWWWTTASSCARWPTSRDRYGGPWTARTSAPVLVVGNYFDGVTDYDGAVASSELLANSRLLSYAGWGHTAFGRSQCSTDHMVRYLLDGTLPPRGTVCPANPNPFVPVEAADARIARADNRPMVGLPPPGLMGSRR